MARLVTVSVDDVKLRWGGTPPFTDEYLRVQIKDAVTELYELIPDVDERISSGQIHQDSITKLIAKAVIGVLRNPEGLKSEAEGDYSMSRFGDGFVWLRPSDVARLAPPPVRVGTIRTKLPCGWQ